MGTNILFLVVISICLVAIIVLLIIQGVQAKKAKGTTDSSEENIPAHGMPIEEYELHSMLSSMTPMGNVYKKALRSYFISLNKIDSMYAEANNDLSKMTEQQIEKMYSQCKKNIYSFKRVRSLEKKMLGSCIDNVPTYNYLSMIYVIRNDYVKAINACVTAIEIDACNQTENIKLKEKVFELAKEADLQLSEKILDIFEKKGL